MAERRQATRREPIEIELHDGRIFTAEPLDWRRAGDLGNEILRQNADSMNELVRMYVTDDNIPQLELKLRQKITDWDALFTLAFPNNKKEDFWQPRVLDTDEAAALILASMEVNHLSHLNQLVDPNLEPLTPIGGIGSSTESGAQMPGAKTESSLNFSSQESPVTPSSPSLVAS
jgi:hypothetical protein